MPGALDKYLNAKTDSEQAKEFPHIHMVLFRWKTGNCLALSYSHFIWLNYDPSIGATLHFSTHTVKLTGVNLFPLVKTLITFATREVLETSERYDESSDEAPCVTGIEATEIHAGADPFEFLEHLANETTPLNAQK